MKILFCLLFSFSAYGQTIVSDYDDTFRVSYGYNLAKSATSYLKKSKYLADYKILFQDIWSGPKYLLSSSPTLLLKRIKRDLRRNQIKIEKFIARSPKNLLNKEYKVQKLKALIEQTSGSVLLIGDDLHKDEGVYKEVASHFPDRVVAFYIRNAESIQSEVWRYNYALDIVLEEWKAQRLDLGQLTSFIDQLLSAPLNLINIKGYKCPILNLNRRKLAIIASLPGSLARRVSEIYLSYSKDCFKKQSYSY